MTRAEYNKMLQTVQEIEVQVGFPILRAVTHRDDDGRPTEHIYCDSNNRRVLWQSHPLTDKAEYFVDDANYGRIVYTDFTR